MSHAPGPGEEGRKVEHQPLGGPSIERTREDRQDQVIGLLHAGRELSPAEDEALADAFVRHLEQLTRRRNKTLTPDLITWIERQHLFFTATTPGDGRHVNCSPKGLDTLRVLDPLTVAYLDLTGSGVETIAHLRDNGSIVLMFCAFTATGP